VSFGLDPHHSKVKLGRGGGLGSGLDADGVGGKGKHRREKKTKKGCRKDKVHERHREKNLG